MNQPLEVLQNSLPWQRTTRIRVEWLVLACVWVIMGAVFFMSLPYTIVDFQQENGYLGVPYSQLQQGNLSVIYADPFGGNGPQAVYPPAYIAFHTGSLKLMRSYLFLFSLVVMGLLFYFFLQKLGEARLPVWKVAIYGFLSLTVWLSIPLALVYPIQVNGFTPGAACVVLGVLLYRRSPYWAMMAFGFAYSFKGQFLALLPGLLFYLYFIDIRQSSFLKHLLYATGALLMFFIPKSVFLTGLWLSLGWFENTKELVYYALDPFFLLNLELTHIMGKIFQSSSISADIVTVNRIRHQEFSGFGLLAWLHIGLSFASCLFFACRTLWKRFRTPWGRSLNVDHGTAVFAFAGLIYWIDYLFFNRYPWWYNVFAVVYMNVFFAAAFAHWASFKLSAHNPRYGRIFLLSLAVLTLAVFGNRIKKEIGPRSPGNSLNLYPWMEKASVPSR